jgi:rare lipoprotein A
MAPPERSMNGSAGASMVRAVARLGLLLLALAGCSSAPPGPGTYKLGQPYQVAGRWYYPQYDPNYDRVGVASWYGEQFHGRPTANGEVFDRRVVTAAHPTLPLPSLVRVTNLDNGRELEIRVNDRGPFVGDRLIDLSQEAARQLGFERQGIAPVRVRFVRLAEARGTPPRPTATPAVVLTGVPGRKAEPAPVAVRDDGPPAAGDTARPPAIPARPVVRDAGEMLAAAGTNGGVAPRVASCEVRFIQVGAFAEPARAQRVVAELQALRVVPVTLLAAPTDRLARVRLGPLPDVPTAGAALDRLKRSGFPEAFIVAPVTPSIAQC